MARSQYSLWLDDDVNAAINEEALRIGRRKSDVVNERLRASFQDAYAALKDIQRARDKGTLDLDQIAEIGRRFGPDARAQALLLAIGGQLNPERKPS